MPKKNILLYKYIYWYSTFTLVFIRHFLVTAPLRAENSVLNFRIQIFFELLQQVCSFVVYPLFPVPIFILRTRVRDTGRKREKQKYLVMNKERNRKEKVRDKGSGKRQKDLKNLDFNILNIWIHAFETGERKKERKT